MNIKKNDKVKILAGKDRGKSGKVAQVYAERNKISVEGLNLIYKNMRPRKQGEAGQRIQFAAPLDASNVAVICPKCNRPTRLGSKRLENQKKVRVCKKCQGLL